MNRDAVKRFRQYITSPEGVFAPGVQDCLTARIAEKAGHKAVYMGGFATSAAVYGKPDVGLITITEMLTHARNVVGSVNVPVFADADTGHGNPLNVRRTIQEYEKAGVAGVHMEDQTHPKKCGNMPDRHVVSVTEMVEKIHAAVDARVNDDFVIAIRSDSYLDRGLNELLDRGHAYIEAGADVFWPLLYNCTSRDEMKKVGASFETPLMGSLVNYSATAFIDLAEWADMGFRVIISPFGALQAAAPVIMALMKEMKETGSLKRVADRLIAFDDLTDLLGLPEIKALEKKHGIR
jgi:2-methylisocitrate lyase-like PEP mutase family enzyme